MSAQSPIGEHEMMDLMVAACPSFRSQWEQFRAEWSESPILYEDGGDGSLPHYLVLSDLADHLISKLEIGDTSDFVAIFEVVEDWIVRGSHYVSEAAVVGLLEDLTNDGRYNNKTVSDFVPWMRPMTRKWVPEVVDFWERLDKGRFRPLSID